MHRVFDGRTDQIGTAKPQPGPIPEHRIAPEDIGQGRERYAPLPQEEGFLDLIRPCAEVRHDKRGPQREDLIASFELDPSQNHPLFTGAIAVVEGIPLAHRLREQFWVLRAQQRHIVAVLRHVCHILLILHFILERHADMLAPTGWRLLLQLCVFHHSTVWSISALPSPLFLRCSTYPQNPLASADLKSVTWRKRVWLTPTSGWSLSSAASSLPPLHSSRWALPTSNALL